MANIQIKPSNMKNVEVEYSTCTNVVRLANHKALLVVPEHEPLPPVINQGLRM